MDLVENKQEKDSSLPRLMDRMSLYDIETVSNSINYGRQLQLQFKRLTKKRFSITIAEGIHPSKGFNVRRTS